MALVVRYGVVECLRREAIIAGQKPPVTMKRDDISDDLVHFIRGDTDEESFKTLQKILEEQQLIGGKRCIKGGYKCVCFSETPVQHLGKALKLLTAPRVGYRPFGVVVTKAWLFSQGGRPVIYQPDDEFKILSPETRWRHVRYEPTADRPINFSWEREWRIQTEILTINPQVARVVLPTEKWLSRLQAAHALRETHSAQMYETILGDVAWGLKGDFPWTTQVL